MEQAGYLKQCSHCLALRPFDEFHRHRGTPDGHHPWCKECRSSLGREERAQRGSSRLEQWALAEEARARCTTCKAIRPLDDFYLSKRNRNGRKGQCIQCYRDKQAARDPIVVAEQRRRSYQRVKAVDPEGAQQRGRQYRFRYKYGIKRSNTTRRCWKRKRAVALSAVVFPCPTNLCSLIMTTETGMFGGCCAASATLPSVFWATTSNLRAKRLLIWAPTPGMQPPKSPRRNPVDVVAVILAVALGLLVNLILIGTIVQILHGNPEVTLSENATQILIAGSGGITGLLGAYIGTNRHKPPE